MDSVESEPELENSATEEDSVGSSCGNDTEAGEQQRKFNLKLCFLI